MKKLIVVLLAACLLFSFVGCHREGVSDDIEYASITYGEISLFYPEDWQITGTDNGPQIFDLESLCTVRVVGREMNEVILPATKEVQDGLIYGSFETDVAADFNGSFPDGYEDRSLTDGRGRVYHTKLSMNGIDTEGYMYLIITEEYTYTVSLIAINEEKFSDIQPTFINIINSVDAK